jgi:hypothetical protein
MKTTSNRNQVESAGDGLLWLGSALLLLLEDECLGGALIRDPQAEIFVLHVVEYNRGMSQ